MPRRKKAASIELSVPQPPVVGEMTVWQALNEPIAYPTPEFVKTFFPVAIFIFLSILALPYFNGTASGSYQTVAGVMIENADQSAVVEKAVTETPDWYVEVKSTAVSLGEFYNESFQQPFSQAATELLDVSGPVMNAKEFLAPGGAALRDAWLELMADPY